MCLVQVFSPNFVYDFLRKMFLMLYYINWPNFLVWLPLLPEMLGNMCIVIVCFPGCYVRNLENFSYMTENPEQQLKQFHNKKSF